jgi:two-component system nitrogen regulation response regulator GlnG
VIKQAMLNASGHVLLPEFLPAEVRRQQAAASSSRPPASDLRSLADALVAKGGKDLYAQAMEALERVLLPRVLQQTQGNQAQASELLGISRGTLRQKLRALGLTLEKVLTDDGQEGAAGNG